MNRTPLNVTAEVQRALDSDHPVVALETALVTHGFAYPANFEITRRMVAELRERGVQPAVVGVWQGTPTVGLSMEQVRALAQDIHSVKVSVRDLPLAGLRSVSGGTTVAATALLAARAEIPVFATGGIGGVHRGHPEDVSADLPVLASTPVIVVCAGAKAILDLPRTLEFLETWGVPVLGWETDEFPAFYSRSSGLPVDARVADAAQVVAAYRHQRALRLSQGLLVTVPVPEAEGLAPEEVEPLIERAVADAEAQGISGRALTPFILARMVELSAQRTQRANESLLLQNVRVAAGIARVLVLTAKAAHLDIFAGEGDR